MHQSGVRPLTRLVLATAALATLGIATAASALGLGPIDLNSLRGYAEAHGVDTRALPELGTELLGLDLGTTPRADCGPGSLPETDRQGRVPLADYASGRAAQGYTCNASEKGSFGQTGGFQVHRYADAAGRECAYYDSTLVFPKDVIRGALGTIVLDMSDPANPVQTASLTSPAMLTTHESLRLNTGRGLLVAGAGNPSTQVGFVDVWDVSADCRTPVLRSSLPIGGLGHEGGFSPDGLTYWVTTTALPGITAIDLTDPAAPSVVLRDYTYTVHGMSFSADGDRAYLADSGRDGMTVLDVSDVQDRVADPALREISTLTWPEHSIPQNVNPVTIGGQPYAIEFDEFDFTFGTAPRSVGGVRIIDISDETAPEVVSRIRLEVHDESFRQTDQRADPGASQPAQGYAAHYCSVPREVEPGILACSMIASGLRIFDIRDPLAPREVAYFNQPAPVGVPSVEGAYAMSAPAFAPERGEVWYSDGNTGFYNVQLTAAAWPESGAPVAAPAAPAPPAAVPAPPAAAPAAPGGPTTAAPPAAPARASRGLPATGLPVAVALLGAALLGGSAAVARRRRSV